MEAENKNRILTVMLTSDLNSPVTGVRAGAGAENRSEGSRAIRWGDLFGMKDAASEKEGLC